MKIGICDWGIGGLGFYAMLDRERPDLDVVYIGDQGEIPYGRLTRAQLAARMRLVFEVFQREGVDHVVVACNAASTVIEDSRLPGQRVTGVIEPGLGAVDGSSSLEIGVIGGFRVVRAGSYSRPLRTQGHRVRQRVAQPLSRMIEDGVARSPEGLAKLKSILAPLRGIDTLVLACTHYVALEPEIKALLPGVTILDPATAAWNWLRAELPPPTIKRGTRTFYTTGDPAAMREQGRVAFGVEMDVLALTL